MIPTLKELAKNKSTLGKFVTKASSVGIITVLRILNITVLPTAKTTFFDELEKHFSFFTRSEKMGDGQSQKKVYN